MHLFHWNILLYLSFHLIGLMFCMASMLGIPGNLDNSDPMTNRVTKAFNLFLNLSWGGTPLLLIGSIVAFYFYWNELGIALSTISLSVGLASFLCLVTLYKLK